MVFPVSDDYLVFLLFEEKGGIRLNLPDYTSPAMFANCSLVLRPRQITRPSVGRANRKNF